MKKSVMITHFVGVDVQAMRTMRGCACAVLRRDGSSLSTTWESEAITLVESVQRIIATDGANLTSVAVGIDGPRTPLGSPREYYWDGKHQQWRPRKRSEKGY